MARLHGTNAKCGLKNVGVCILYLLSTQCRSAVIFCFVFLLHTPSLTLSTALTLYKRPQCMPAKGYVICIIHDEHKKRALAGIGVLLGRFHLALLGHATRFFYYPCCLTPMIFLLIVVAPRDIYINL